MKSRMRTVLILTSVALMTSGCGFSGDHIGITDRPDPRPTEPGPMDPFETPPLEMGPTVMADVPPPPIQGGTLTLSADERFAIAADPDRDDLFIVELSSQRVTPVVFEDHDEPGRVVTDEKGIAHVVLRGGGALVSVDIESGDVLRRTPMCSSPSGLAYDETARLLHVACVGGQLLSVNPEDHTILRQIMIEPDLRDVVVSGDALFLTLFRSAQVLEYNRDLGFVARHNAPDAETMRFDEMRGETRAHFRPAVAWRAVATPEGVVVSHQRGMDDEIVLDDRRGGGSAYGGDDPCGGSIVQSVVTPFRPGLGASDTPQQNVAFSVLPVDIADYPSRGGYLVVSAGTGLNTFMGMPAVTFVRKNQPLQDFNCDPGEPVLFAEDIEPVAVAATEDGQIFVQSRQPAELLIVQGFGGAPARVRLSDEDRVDTGHKLFHVDTGAGIACASCHPGGTDDARVWTFSGIGPRRTQNFRGGILGTEPFHWDGDMHDFSMLVDHVFVSRMGAQQPEPEQVDAFARYLDSIPAQPVDTVYNSDPEAVARGRQIFNSETTECSKCHAGVHLTNNKSEDVGTGGTFQVPHLKGIANRAPYMHSGCASTLHARFLDNDCGGGDKHGKTSHLSPAQIDDLVAYLETL